MKCKDGKAYHIVIPYLCMAGVHIDNKLNACTKFNRVVDLVLEAEQKIFTRVGLKGEALKWAGVSSPDVHISERNI